MRLPDHAEAYVARSLVEGMAKPIAVRMLRQELPLLDEAQTQASPMERLSTGTAIPVVATYEQFELVRRQDGLDTCS